MGWWVDECGGGGVYGMVWGGGWGGGGGGGWGVRYEYGGGDWGGYGVMHKFLFHWVSIRLNSYPSEGQSPIDWS
ncbi:unnamed protein product [Dicrocoelium dendriticum]|nr:unnamed protein product [Dicrocoelium dendriticum]